MMGGAGRGFHTPAGLGLPDSSQEPVPNSRSMNASLLRGPHWKGLANHPPMASSLRTNPTPYSFLFLQHPKLFPIPGPLHMLFPIPRAPFPLCSWGWLILLIRILARGHLLGEAFPNCPISVRHHPPPPTLHPPPLCDFLHSTQHCLKLSYLFICLFCKPHQGKDCLRAHCSSPVPPRSLTCSKHLEYVEWMNEWTNEWTNEWMEMNGKSRVAHNADTSSSSASSRGHPD